uniref:Serine hydrolase domain-containing protein n=1 Tax=Opuntia streptacantha TaxID=393608 RepID=A0A7C8ZS34_OPUST
MLRILPGVNINNTMGSNGHLHHESRTIHKPRFLCLHGFRTSAQILKKQIQKWPDSVRQKLDLVFVDAPFPAQGKSDVEGIFDPPYYEWFQFNKVSLSLCLSL